MAITRQGVTTAGNSNGTSLTGVTRPTTTADDVFVLDMYLELPNAPADLTFSNGTWVKKNKIEQVGSVPDFQHYRYRSTYVSEGSTFDITWTGGAVWRACVVNAYRGVDTSTPDDTTATEQASASSSTSAVAPGLTTSTNGALIIYGEADFDGQTVTGPTGSTPTFTEQTDFANLQVADGALATAGATGDKTGTLAGASWNTAGLIALRPAPDAPSGIRPESPTWKFPHPPMRTI